ncbi:MAG: hypothetical protein IKP93_06515, partial [Paludibacteraceae bacterium]|nr:hypothetical protein [Paludibacteraceae bacterium]
VHFSSFFGRKRKETDGKGQHDEKILIYLHKKSQQLGNFTNKTPLKRHIFAVVKEKKQKKT